MIKVQRQEQVVSRHKGRIGEVHSQPKPVGHLEPGEPLRGQEVGPVVCKGIKRGQQTHHFQNATEDREVWSLLQDLVAESPVQVVDERGDVRVV